MIGGKLIAVRLQSFSGGNAFNPLVAFSIIIMIVNKIKSKHDLRDRRQGLHLSFPFIL
jgi:hypothetical protein